MKSKVIKNETVVHSVPTGTSLYQVIKGTFKGAIGIIEPAEEEYLLILSSPKSNQVGKDYLTGGLDTVPFKGTIQLSQGV